MIRPPSRFRHWIVIAALTGLTIAAYAPAFRAGFVDYDDNRYVAENERVAQGLTADNVAWAFATRTASNWHPLTWLSYMLDAELFGIRPQAFHAVNVALHTLNAIVLYFVLGSMTTAHWRSALVAALFAVHPLHVESVAWISERKDVLSTLFALLAIGAYGRWVRRRSIAMYVAMSGLLVASLMAKPMWVTFPFALLLIDFWPLGRLGERECRSAAADRRGGFALHRVVEKLPLFAIAAASCVATLWAQRGHAMTDIHTLPLSMRLINAIVAYGTYLFQTVYPVNLSAIVPHPGNWPIWRVAVSGSALLAITNWIAARRRDRPALWMGWLWFLGTLVPVIGLVQVGGQAHADRYTYVPLIGVFVAIAWSLPATPSQRTRRACAAASCLVLLLLGWRTFAQTRTWHDTDALYGHAIALDSRNFIAHTNLAYSLARRGEYAAAEEHFDAALRQNPIFAARNDPVGRLLVERGRFDRALPHYRRIAEAIPGVAMHQNNAGVALLRLGRAEESLPYFEKAIALDARRVSAHVNRGEALAYLGRWDEAEREQREALRLDPASADAHHEMGLILVHREKWHDAISHFEEALRIRPGDEEVRGSLRRAKSRLVPAARPTTPTSSRGEP